MMMGLRSQMFPVPLPSPYFLSWLDPDVCCMITATAVVAGHDDWVLQLIRPSSVATWGFNCLSWLLD